METGKSILLQEPITRLGMSHVLLKLQGDFVLCFSLLVNIWVKSMLLAYG